jgi:hypothetical protein
MKATRYTLLSILFYWNISFGIAQPAPAFSCGFDVLRSATQESLIQSFENQLLEHLLQKKKSGFPAQESALNLPYIVPVVVHIIHNGGPENIPDAQIFAAIEHLNAGFAAQGYYAQQGATENTQIQFCMAKRDPSGYATNGINRIESPLTNVVAETQDEALKNLIRWNPNDYVNIWVVNKITSLSIGSEVNGYAYFPSLHGTLVDGIVCAAGIFGKSPAEDAVLIHEMGHYLGLYHTFEGGCLNNDCNLDGDKICDTPPDNATHTACPFNSCSTDIAPGSPFLTDVDDLTGNFLDYSPFSCYHLFTANQATRMQSALETARLSLLSSRGCDGPCTQPIDAAFTAVPNPVLVGEPVVFTNNTSNASNFSWIDNGVEFSQNEDVSRVFNNAGIHTIILKATNSDPNCVGTAFALLDVQCPIQAGFAPNTLEAIEGDTLNFSNTSAGGAPLNYEWSVNGQPVSNDIDIDYWFQNSGIYIVTLKAIGALCQSEVAMTIKIANPCGLFPEPAQVAYTGQQKLFQARDMLVLADGSTIFCGEHFQQPMVTKWDSDGELLWNKESPINGSFTQIEPTPDGNFLLFGENADVTLFIAKINEDGNFLWIKTLQNIPIEYKSARHLNPIAVNPDGSFGLVHKSEFNNGIYITKLTSDGEILWSRKIPLISQVGSLKVSKNGSGDFVFVTRISFNANTFGFSVFFFSQTGVFTAQHDHGIPNTTLPWVKNYELDVHADGGYSINFTDGNNAFSPALRRYIIRCNSDGSVKWTNRYQLLNGNTRNGAYFRQVPDEEGWVIIDSRLDANGQALGDFLERLDSDGQILWTRHLGDTPVNDIFVMPPVCQSGRIRGVHSDFFNQDLKLLNVPDSDVQTPCIPPVPNGGNIISLLPTFAAMDTIPIPASEDINTEDLPLVFNDVHLTRREVCSNIQPCPEICDNQLDDDGDGLVDCFDSDCDCFDLDTTCTIVLLDRVKVPDVSIVVDSTQCRTDSFDLFLKLCNVGSAPLPEGTPISFYAGDPSSTPAALLFPPILFQEALDIGTCKSLVLSIPALYNTSIFAVANDDGTLPRPYNLASNFLSTDQPECHFENNLSSFSIQNQTPLLDLGPDISLCKSSVIALAADPNFQRYRWQDGSTASSITAYSAGKYWVDAFDACGFLQTDTVHIALNTLETLDLPTEFVICAGESLELAASGFPKYTWSPADSLSCASCDTVNVLAKESITIYLTATNGDCFVSDSVRIHIHPVPQIQLLAQDGNCDTPASITANVSGEAPFEFLWSNFATDSILFPLQSGVYTVQVLDSNGCNATATASISTAGVTPVLNLTTDTLSCAKTTGLIAASSNLPNTLFLWSGNDGFSSISPTPTIAQSGTFTVVATDPLGGCTATGTIFVPSDTSAPTVQLASNFLEIPCGQTTVTISAEGSSSGLQFSTEWTALDGGTILSGANTLSPMVGGTGTYKLLIANLSNGCTANGTVEVTESEPPTASATADSVRCFGETNGVIQVVSTTGLQAPLLYSIDNQIFTEDSIFDNLPAGFYQIYILDANGCEYSTEVAIGQPAPMALELTGDTLVLAGAIANLQVLITPPGFVPTQIDWFANGTDVGHHQLGYSTQVLENTIFQVRISDEHGCTGTDNWLVRIGEAHKVYAPNAIFPGSPSGENQTFLIYTNPDALKIKSLHIFDRWGSQVFFNQNFPPNDESHGWDGTYRGQLVTPGVYVWMAKVVFKDGTEELLQGDLTILR